MGGRETNEDSSLKLQEHCESDDHDEIGKNRSDDVSCERDELTPFVDSEKRVHLVSEGVDSTPSRLDFPTSDQSGRKNSLKLVQPRFVQISLDPALQSQHLGRSKTKQSFGDLLDSD